MNTLPLFNAYKTIETTYHSEAEIVLYHGDVNDYVASVPDNSVSLIITSPPYNLGKDYEDRVSIPKYLEVQGRLISRLDRVLKDDGSICWQVGNFVDRL